MLLAPLEPDEQRRWLQRASEERLSVADLRLELRTLREGEGKSGGSAEVVVDREDEMTVCPHCGHSLRLA